MHSPLATWPDLLSWRMLSLAISATMLKLSMWKRDLILLNVEQCAFTQASYSSLFLKPVCMASTSAWMNFKWLHPSLASRQPTVNHHTTGWWAWPCIKLLYVPSGGEHGANEVIWQFLVKTYASLCSPLHGSPATQ